MSFTHLQVRSGYSLLDSTITINKLVQRASELNFGAIALTDQNVLYGAIQFYKLCLQYNIKPIIGMIVTIETDELENEQCTLLAKTNAGYRQLMKISSIINQNKQTAIKADVLQHYTKELICILPVDLDAKLGTLLNESTYDEVNLYINKWHCLFNESDFYLGIQDLSINNKQPLHYSIKAFNEIYKIPVVPINDVHFLKEQDDIVYHCLQAIKNNERWESMNVDPSIKYNYLRSSEEMKQALVSFWPELLEETERIKDKCDVTFDFNKRLIPSFPTPEQKDAHQYLETLCWEGVNQRYKKISSEVSERLVYELKVIRSMKFSDYFLIVWDFIRYAKQNQIVVGPGRGSAAGSLVAYVLGITEVDPIQYDLLFERFLNPARMTMPDIDVDFSDYKRDEVIDYVRNKYGEDHVAQIITFGTFSPRSIVRELIKTFEVNQPDAAYLLDHVPVQSNQSMANAIRDSSELKQYINQSEKLRTLFTIAIKLDGLPRNLSTHAAGIVITDEPLADHIPMAIGSNGMNLSQYPMDDLEKIGLLKIDFLGLRNLTFLENMLKAIHNMKNQKIMMRNIPENDKKTYTLLKNGQTNGIFQLESKGMKQVLTKLKPSNFEDIVAVNALYRPGPMESIPSYINRKHGNETISYIHPTLTPILKKTFGVLIYQEQMMQIIHEVTGYSLGKADIIRRVISKKQHNEIEKQKTAFIKGGLNQGYDKSVSEQIFSWIVKFSDYGFNRSHAVAYSKISYALAYIKAHYPAQFFAELLSSVTNQHTKIYHYINEAKELKIDIQPPSINHSYGKYTVEQEAIRVGFLSIKGIGHQDVKEIVRVRKDGPFTSLFDFCLRVSLKVINRKTIESLIFVGAFDETHSNRASLLASIDQAIDQGELFREFNLQSSLLTTKIELKAEYTKMKDFSQMIKLSDEKELLGFYVSTHPLKKLRKDLKVNGYLSLRDARQKVGARKLNSVAIIHTIKKIRTKRGDPMAFIDVGDEETNMDAVVFPDLYRTEKNWLKEENMVVLSGSIEERNNQIQWVLSDIKPFKEKDLVTNRLFIKILDKNIDQALKIIKQAADDHSGQTPIIIYHNKKTYQLSEEYNIDANKDCLDILKTYFGNHHVVLD